MEKIFDYIKSFSQAFFPEIGLFLLKLIGIVVLMVVVLEILKAFKILDFLNKLIYPLTKHLGISQSATLPLLVGILAGLTYGAGAIIASYNNHDMSKKDVCLVCSFLCICHGILEDTILFASIGAKWWIMVLVRVSVAIIVTLITRYILNKASEKINKNINEMENK